MPASRAVKSSAFRLPPSAFKSSIAVKVANRQRRLPISTSRLRTAIQTVLAGEGISRADISLAVIDDDAIHDINRRYLQHDQPTDVISFALDRDDGFVDGEIVVSADTAVASARQIGWSAGDELLLYVIHGALHLAGYDDLLPAARRKMRARERFYLAQLGTAPADKPATKSKRRSSRNHKPQRSALAGARQGAKRR